ncbi:acetyl-coenzyme A synthetase [Halalkalicoccus paucihalophilus]|uniref:Acetyl-coenzyme A synthetase n=1 Tax=Halalkalicoccus paucihalophilus TaxID=1008153 RepID=A0A151A8M2_9EURY|nr:acyl-CoA synthetase [Halalkalicoccus paucihalophilus]KYH23842.1 acetyl-coenzyme A synthetase [Halalkalicoccus paucihalophilus]
MQSSIPSEYLPDEADGPDYVHAVPEVHYPRQINVAEELVDRHVREGQGNNVAVYFEDQTISYAELQEAINRMGNTLLDLGVEPGDRVVVRFPNRPEAVVSCLAAQKIGAVALPSMKLLRAAELEHIINNAEATTVVVYDDLLEEVENALPNLETVEDVVVADRNGIDHNHHDYDELLDDASADLDAYETERDDLALMLYTSGTTGEPKGAIHTHQNLLASADTYARYCLEPTEEDVFGGNPPLPFAYGYGDLVTFPLRFGASTSLVEDATPGDLLAAIDSHGISVLCSIPTAFNQILSKYPDGPEEYDVSSLRVGASAGEPLTPTTFESFKDEYGIDLLDGIGTTEMLHIFISHRHDEEIDPSATGFPVPGYECKIVDPETGEECDRGEAGLLAVRGPTGIEYWNRPEKQANAVRDNWSYPGDIFVQREDGRFEYKSRNDDLIISSGYNIPGPEVEAVIEEHDSVGEVAVVGSPDEERGAIVKAFVVAADGVSPEDNLIEEIQNHVKDTLAPYKYPREVEFVHELPRTETGKIRRIELRKREEEKKA